MLSLAWAAHDLIGGPSLTLGVLIGEAPASTLAHQESRTLTVAQEHSLFLCYSLKDNSCKLQYKGAHIFIWDQWFDLGLFHEQNELDEISWDDHNTWAK